VRAIDHCKESRRRKRRVSCCTRGRERGGAERGRTRRRRHGEREEARASPTTWTRRRCRVLGGGVEGRHVHEGASTCFEVVDEAERATVRRSRGGEPESELEGLLNRERREGGRPLRREEKEEGQLLHERTRARRSEKRTHEEETARREREGPSEPNNVVEASLLY